MKVITAIAQYIAAVFTLLIGIGMAGQETYAMAALVCGVAILILPPVWGRIVAPTGQQKLLAYGSAGLVIVAVVFGGEQVRARAEAEALVVAQRKAQEDLRYFADNRDAVISQMKSLLKDNKNSAAVSLFERYRSSGDAELMKLGGQAKERAHAEALSKEVAALKKKLDSITDTDGTEALAVYERLAKIDTDKTWSKLAASTKQKLERRKLIEKQFSAWDGSHVLMARSVKKSMNDPDSFDHVETRYIDRGDHISVYMKFRGKNAFNATVLGSAYGEFKIDGSPIKVEIN